MNFLYYLSLSNALMYENTLKSIDLSFNFKLNIFQTNDQLIPLKSSIINVHGDRHYA